MKQRCDLILHINLGVIYCFLDIENRFVVQ